jgi:DNA-binding response OmpR family regulator
MRALIVTPNTERAKEVAGWLRQGGHHVTVSGRPREFVAMPVPTGLHLIVVEPTGVPHAELLGLCRRIGQHRDVLLVLVGGLVTRAQRMLALRAGAAAYPADPAELLPHLEAALRLHPICVVGGERQQIQVTDVWWLDLAAQYLVSDTSTQRLPRYEFELLRYLVLHKGLVLTRHQLLDAVWGADCPSSDREVDHYIYALRKKIEPDPKRPRYLVMRYGSGYAFRGTRPEPYPAEQVAGTST